MVISKKLLFLKSPDRGVAKFRGSNLFQADGAQLHFSIKPYRTRCFPGGSRLPAPSGFVHCLCARVNVCGNVKSPKTKHAVSSSKA